MCLAEILLRRKVEIYNDEESTKIITIKKRRCLYFIDFANRNQIAFFTGSTCRSKYTEMWLFRIWREWANGRIKNFVGRCVSREISVLNKNVSRYIWGIVSRFDPRPPSSISTSVLTFFRHILMHHSSLRISNSRRAPMWNLLFFLHFTPRLLKMTGMDQRQPLESR